MIKWTGILIWQFWSIWLQSDIHKLDLLVHINCQVSSTDYFSMVVVSKVWSEGDPILLYMFILCKEVLSRLINRAVEEGNVKEVSSALDCEVTTVWFFVVWIWGVTLFWRIMFMIGWFSLPVWSSWGKQRRRRRIKEKERRWLVWVPWLPSKHEREVNS